MIKFALRRNLKYPALLIVFNCLRAIEKYLIIIFLEFDITPCSTLLMFLGEILAGLIYYLKDYKYFSNNKKENPIQFINIGYYKSVKSTPRDKKSKIIFLIFISSFFDFIQFLFSVALIKYVNKSITLEQRFRGILTIYTALLSRCFLNLNIDLHQRISIFIILICLVSLIISEIIIIKFDFFFPAINLIYIAITLFFVHLFCSFQFIIEKYLLEYNQTNPYLLLMIEGIFGIIISIIYYVFFSPLDDIIRFYNKKSPFEFFMLIMGFIFYMILSGGKNLFRLLTTKIFNPMTTTFMDYLFNPFYIIVSFIFFGDFISDGERNWITFGTNLFISCIISFFGGVYNEFIILFCCGLDRETHNQIVRRSVMDKNLSNLYEDDDDISLTNSASPYIFPLQEINNSKINEFSE